MWVARRRGGESAALIADAEGVTEGAVLRATAHAGPFPRPSRQLGRTLASGSDVAVRTEKWVAARRRGVQVQSLADQYGVSHQWVTKCTAGRGPFPAPEVVDEWVRARRTGEPPDRIADRCGAPVTTVRRATRPHGPFPRRGPRLPDGVVGMNELARRVGISHPVLLTWRRAGRLPDPDFRLENGRTLWLEATVTRWLAGTDLQTCPECGARCVGTRQHRALAHRGQV